MRENENNLTAADIRMAAEKLNRIESLDRDAEALIEVFSREGGVGKRGSEIRRAIAPSYLGKIGSEVLGRIVLQAILDELAAQRAALVAQMGIPVEIPHRTWQAVPAEEGRSD